MKSTKIISAVIFDCDGVLFDSRQANINFYNHVLARFHLGPLKEDDIAFVHSNTADAAIRHIFQGTSYVEDARAYRLTMDYMPFVKDMVLEPGVKALLEVLRPHYALAIATNRSNTIGDVLKWHGIAEYFGMVISSLDVKNPKPHPEGLERILRHFGLQPHEAVYVGDSPVDHETAQGAQVIFISYRNDSLDTPHRVGSMVEIPWVLERIQTLGHAHRR